MLADGGGDVQHAGVVELEAAAATNAVRTDWSLQDSLVTKIRDWVVAGKCGTGVVVALTGPKLEPLVEDCGVELSLDPERAVEVGWPLPKVRGIGAG